MILGGRITHNKVDFDVCFPYVDFICGCFSTSWGTETKALLPAIALRPLSYTSKIV